MTTGGSPYIVLAGHPCPGLQSTRIRALTCGENPVGPRGVCTSAHTPVATGQSSRREVLGELRGTLGRLGYLSAGGGKAMFVAAADLSMLYGPPQTSCYT